MTTITGPSVGARQNTGTTTEKVVRSVGAGAAAATATIAIGGLVGLGIGMRTGRPLAWMRELGVGAVYTPGQPLASIVEYLNTTLAHVAAG